jgi:putative DNA primase/helicase
MWIRSRQEANFKSNKLFERKDMSEINTPLNGGEISNEKEIAYQDNNVQATDAVRDDGISTQSGVSDKTAGSRQEEYIGEENPLSLPSNVIVPIQCDENGYYHKADGSLWKKAKESSEEDICVSENYIKVTGLIRTLESDKWYTRIEFKDLDGHSQTIDMRCSILLDPKEPLRALADRGFAVPVHSQKHISAYLQAAKPTRRIRQINKTGWINDRAYICSSFKVLSLDNKEEYELIDVSKDRGYGIGGTLEEWQEHVAEYCADNHILTLSLCVGLSGPLQRFFPHIGTTVVNLIGKTSSGKTTALRAAASLWGSQKYVKQWRATDNSLESIAEAHNDGLLVLDDLGQVDAKKVGEIAYMLGNQMGKGRCNADSSLKKIKSWSLSILSSGEVSLEDKLNEDGCRAKGGQKVRFIDIDAIVSDEHGIYNNLYGFKSGAELSNCLKEQTSKYYGIVSERFVHWLIEQGCLVDRLNSLYQQAKEKLINKFCLSEADGEVLRVVDVFALYATTGTLAVTFGIFPESLKVNESIEFIFERWLNDRGGKRNVDEEEVVQHVMDFLMQHSANFIELRDGRTEENRTTYNLLGYFQKENDSTTYYIIPTSFKEEICKGFSVKTVRHALKKKGMLEMDGKDNPKKTVNGSRAHFVTIVVKQDGFDGGNQSCDET